MQSIGMASQGVEGELKHNIKSIIIACLLSSCFVLTAGCGLFADESIENLLRQNEKVEPLSITSIEWTNGLPTPQEKGGVYLFTKQNHPDEIAYSFQWNQYDVLLVQSNAEKLRGYTLEILGIEKVLSGIKESQEADKSQLLRIVVRLSPGEDAQKPNAMPASRYVEIERGLIDMEKTEFQIVNENGEEVPLN